MAKHTPGFLKIVDEARRLVKECSVEDVKQRLDRSEDFLLIDCREDSEWEVDHLPNAIHIGKGVIERDIETKVPDPSQEIVIYCGGGFRSALAGASLVKMGYKNVTSMDGGIRSWRDFGFPLVKSKR